MNWKIIKQFTSKNIFGFTTQDLVREFPESNRIHLARKLADLVNKGMLLKTSRDNYHIIPLNADPDTYVPDRHQVAKYLMQNKEYYLGYASALGIHGLPLQSQKLHGLQFSSLKHDVPTVQSESRVYIVTKKQMKPAIRCIGGIRYQFILHNTNRFFGFNSVWINQYEKAMVSDLEKTIVDIATRPQFSGGIVEVGNVILQAKDRMDPEKLFYYFARNRNMSAKKRYLFLTNLLGLEWTAEHERMMNELGSGISLLDPGMPDQGRNEGNFGLKTNVNPILLKNRVLHGNLP